MSAAHSRAYSPAHITGFFRIHDHFQDLAKVGSTGAVVTLEQGVITKVSLKKSLRQRITIRINGKPLKDPNVSALVVREFVKRRGESWNVAVSHLCRLPIGSGYGTSGAGALGLSMALNEAMGDPVSKLEAARIAHEAEVSSRTGLGTVMAVFHGGFVVRLKPGAPGKGKIRKLAFSRFERIVSGSFGPMYTPTILSRPHLRSRVNFCGKGLAGRLLNRPRVDTFLFLSRHFSECLNLMTPRLRRLVKLMDNEGFSSSMMMIGEAVFCIVHEDLAEAVARLMRRTGVAPVISGISSRGARLL